jgi:energy-coupling factor transporter ATP-binding protein EcfA2
MGHWHALSAISPSVTRAELYRLGHLEDYTKKSRQDSDSHRRRGAFKAERQKAVDLDTSEVGAKDIYRDLSMKSREVRVLVLGSRACGKTALLNALCGTYDASWNVKAIDTSPTKRPETSAAFVKMRRSFVPKNGSGGSAKVDEREGEEFVVHLVFTDVPEAAAARQEEYYRELSELFGSTTSPKDRVCDLAMLVFDCTNPASFEAAKEMESHLLTKETPRVFVGAKSDLVVTGSDTSGARPPNVLEQAMIHCKEFDLEPPLLTSASESSLGSGGSERARALEHFARCAISDEPGVEHLKSRPHEERKRREAARRRKIMWIGGIVSVGVVVAVGVGLLLGGSAKKDQKTGLNWIRNWFTGSNRTGQGRPQSA